MAQVPPQADLPTKFDASTAALLVNHFPATVFATTDEDIKDYQYCWKHTTSVLSPTQDIQIEECGAYIYYNDQWNLRVSYTPKQFAKLFDCRKGKMKKGQPYTFKDNWRTDNALRAGWAMWYFIGTNATGERVHGIGKIFTAGEVYTP